MMAINPVVYSPSGSGQVVAGENYPQKAFHSPVHFGEKAKGSSKGLFQKYPRGILWFSRFMAALAFVGATFHTSWLFLSKPELKSDLRPILEQTKKMPFQLVPTSGMSDLNQIKQEIFNQSVVVHLADLWAAHEKALKSHGGSSDKAFESVKQEMFEQLAQVSKNQPEVLEGYFKALKGVKHYHQIKPILHRMLDEFLLEADPAYVQETKAASDRLFTDAGREIGNKEDRMLFALSLTLAILLTSVGGMRKAKKELSLIGQSDQSIKQDRPNGGPRVGVIEG